MVLKGFDIEQIHFAVFEALKRSSKGIFGLFLERCGLLGRSEIYLPKIVTRNISTDPLSQWIGQKTSQGPIRNLPKKAKLAGLARQSIDQIYGEHIKTSLLTRKEVKRFRSIFAPLNKSVMGRLHNKSEYLAEPDIHIPEDRLMRDDLSSEFWDNYNQKINGLTSSKSKS